MPIYEYEPTVFSADEPYRECCYFEELEGVSVPAIAKCPKCGHSVHRVISSFHHVTKTEVKKDSLKGKFYDAFQDNPIDQSHELVESEKLFQKGGSDSASKRAARLAARHMCGVGCRH